MLTDDVGRPARAVGVMEALPQGSRGPGIWAPGRHRLPERLMADLIMGMRANLELDTVDSFLSLFPREMIRRYPLSRLEVTKDTPAQVAVLAVP